MYFTLVALLLGVVYGRTPIDRQSLDPKVLQAITFDHKTTAKNGMEIGWKEIMTCLERHGGPKFVTQEGYFIGGITTMEKLAPYAVAIKFVPDGTNQQDIDNYAVYTEVCSNPVMSINNRLEPSYKLNPADLSMPGNRGLGWTNAGNNWNGWYAVSTQARARLKNWCFGGNRVYQLRDTGGFLYHACGNVGGIHVADGHCEWDWTNPRHGRKISMYFGFDAKKKEICDGSGVVGQLLKPALDPCANVQCPDTGNACSYNQCVEGTCVEANYVKGHDCADSDKCNGDEACDGNGKCMNGIKVECDDTNECTTDTCDPNTGTCSNTPAENAPCDNGDACDTDDTCDAQGVCQAGMAVTCEFAERCDAGQCVPDCDVFAVDAYMGVCSSFAFLDPINEAIADVNDRIDNLRLGIYEVKPEEQKENAIPVVTLDLFNKDTLIIALLVVNMVSFFYICWISRKSNEPKYKNVSIYSSEEESKPINNL